MAQSSNHFDQSSVVRVTLGSIVCCGDDYGVVWQVTPDMLRVLPIKKGTTCVALPLASEVALHLPASAIGWSIVYDQLHPWPRARCHIVGELEERCLLRVLEARNSPSAALAAALVHNAMLAAGRHPTRFF
jgi:hypothetical protein